jgi:sugar O-acyltransferase (sialic acid O-acetyltransferase NeuD family)
MSPRIIVIGGGGHGRVVIDALLAAGADIAGVVDPDPAVAARLPQGIPYMGGDGALAGIAPASVLLALGIGAVDVPHQRRRIFERYRKLEFRFATVIHPSVIRAADVELGEGAQVLAGAVLQIGCRLGVNALVNTRAVVEHDAVVGDHACVSPGAVLAGGVVLETSSYVGLSASVLQNIRVGAEAMVAAGAVVIADVPPGARVAGVPARQMAAVETAVSRRRP